MPEPSYCTTCDSALPAGSPGGHCPHCLLGLTLAADIPVEDTAWTTLSGCELYEEIGRGGMGVVYRARQKALDRIVAVKVLLRAQFAGRAERDRFHREARAAARLQHPGIVGIFDVGEDDGVPWFSMEHIAGQGLDQVVREHPMEAHAAAACVQRVAEALQHAHEHGVLHRDLKPSNILLDASGAPRITDFGIARLASSDTTTDRQAAELTRTGQMLGSPGYAAPEQALAGHADERTDVYGLGALLYHLLTGHPPFQGPTLDAILVQLRDRDPLSPRRLNPTVPRDLETICLKCLHKQPEGRYATAAAVAVDLGRFVDGHPILARPISLLGQSWRLAQRYPMVTLMLTIIAILVVALISGSIAFARQQARLEHRASLLSASRALRQQHLAGNRTAALRSLQEAWSIQPSDEIRNEAIAFLASPEITAPHRIPADSQEAQAPDPTLSGNGRCSAHFDTQGDVVVIERSTQRELARLKGHPPKSMLKLDDRSERIAIVHPGSGALSIVSLKDSKIIATCQHPLAVSSMDWSGDLIATGCENRFIYIWDDQGRMKHRFTGHEDEGIRVRFRPHSQELASVCQDQYIRLWHAARGVEILRREAEDSHDALWWSADGALLYANANRAKQRGVDVFRVQKSSCLDLLSPPQEEPHSENLGSAAFSPDGELAAVMDEQSGRLWDFRTGRLVASFPKAPGQWLSAQFAPDGKRLWLCGWDVELTGYDLSRDESGYLHSQVATAPMLDHGNLLRAVSRDGAMMVLSNNGFGQFIVTWPQTRKTLRLKHPGNLATALSPDGTWLVTSSYLTPGAKVWSLPDGKLLRTLCPHDTVKQTVITPDGQRLIASTSDINRLFLTSDWSEETTLREDLRLTSMAASPDGKYLATISDNEVRVLHAGAFTEAFHLILPTHIGWLGETHLVFDHHGSYLLLHTALGSVVRWNLKAVREELEKMKMNLPD